MKRIILMVLMLRLTLVGFNQIIEGTIYDSDTKMPVYSAAIYFNGTSAGTLSNREGHFSLDVRNFTAMPLSVSALGYYSSTIQKFLTGEPVIVYLKPRVFSLDEVVVNEKSHAMERKKNLRIFTEIFLGTTSNAKKCEIINTEDIRFTISYNRDTLKAFAIKPILIDNVSLGYKVTYYLEDFLFNLSDSSFLINGEITFRDKKDSVAGVREKMAYDRLRRSAYLGSRMHLFRSLWFNELDSAGFEIRNQHKDSVRYTDLVFQDNVHSKYLKHRGVLSVYYKVEQEGTLMVFKKDSIPFDPNGYYEPYGISWEGEMAKRRIADMLPYDYSIGK